MPEDEFGTVTVRVTSDQLGSYLGRCLVVWKELLLQKDGDA